MGGSALCVLAFSSTFAGVPSNAQVPQPGTAPSAPAGRPDERPNIIFLLAGDLAAGVTGFEGNTLIRTPNLDRLAGESAYFSRCYAPAPQSAPARATILTGQYPHTHRVTTDGPAPGRNTDTFTLRLRKQGYACGLVGRWWPPDDKAADPGFGLSDYFAIDNGQWKNADTWVNGRKGNADKYLTDWETDRAVEFLEKFHNRRFFLWVGFHAPGEPLESPPGDGALYPPESIRLPQNLTLDITSRPASINNSPAARRFAEKKKDENSLRNDRSRYYAIVSRLDRNVGRILDRAGELGLSRNTVVVFACNNGYAIGDHALYGKGPAFYEELVRGPLLLRVPGMTRPPGRIERIVGLVDLAPTFLELAGLRKPFSMQGDSLIRILNNPDTPALSDEAFFEYERYVNPATRPGEPAEYPCVAHGVVARNFKYVEYAGGEFVFYDLKRDPGEMNNLGLRLNDPMIKRNYEPLRRVLQDRLTRWRRQTRDPTLK